ncbi:fructosamine kinase [Sordaria brevicollis]|uniref:protein-ribulosamine 3-kinase n=1 Tax=Sordaria brevicollis TaxID=83679 RepID=A0AAE0PCP0_SORBR|nr:fructosamine kinase [Sordaria brevicollis]
MSSPSTPRFDTKASHQAAILAKKTNPSTGQPVEVDSAIVAALPSGHRFVRAIALGGSLWCQTAKIETSFSHSATPNNDCSNNENHTEVPVNFFLKTTRGPIAEKMFTGEFAGMTALHEALPEFAPKPIAFGPCSNNDETSHFFFLESYIPMSLSEPLNPRDFCSQLARLHKSTTGTSPTGKFGFGTTTCNGNIAQLVDWEERWDVFFAKGLKWSVDLHSTITGTLNEDLRNGLKRLCKIAIPHLLSPLRLKDSITHQPIKPCLVHGDLWIGNTGTDSASQKPVIYDPAAFYAHNEYELGNWVPERCGFGGLEGEFVREYKAWYPPAEPGGEWEDRVRLYSFRFELQFCCLFPGQEEPKRVMKAMIEDMHKMCDKYGGRMSDQVE